MNITTTRRRRRRGNEYTPYIHSIAIVSAFLITAGEIESIGTTNYWASLGRALGLFFVAEIVIALIISFTMAWWLDRQS